MRLNNVFNYSCSLWEFRILVSFCLMISIHNTVHSQDETPLPYSVRFYNSKQGLPQNQILDITEGKNGMIVSTINGTVSYNGIEFLSVTSDENYKIAPCAELFYNQNTDELFGWASNTGNYFRLFPDNKKLTTYSCISFDKSFLIGIKENGIIETSSYDTKTVHSTLKTDIENAYAIESFENNYFVADGKYLYKVDKNTGKKQIILDGFFNLLKKNPFKDELIAIKNGVLFFIDTNGIREFQLIDTDLIGFFRDVEFLNPDEIMLASQKGLYHLKNGNLNFYNTYDKSNLGSLYSIYYHKPENCIFLGTENRGLMLLTPLQAKTYYTDSKTIDSQSFASVIQDKSGAIYSSASKGNIIQVLNGRKKTYLSLDEHIAALSYIDEKIYVGWWNRDISTVSIYNNGSFTESTSHSFPAPMAVRSIFEDSENNIWLGTNASAVKLTPDKKVYTISTVPSTIVCAYELKNGTICFGTTNGVFFLNKEGNLIKHLGEKQGLKSKEVRAFYEDEHNRLWIGAYSGGLYVYDKNRLTSLNNKPNCALNQDVFTLAKSDGHFYMSSNQGVWSVSEQGLYDFYEDKVPYLVPEYYGEEIGIENTEFNGGFQNNYQKSGDNLYFPSIYGLVELTLEDKPYRKLVPQFKSILVNDTLVSPTTTTFERTTHTVQFNFYCPTYSEQYNLYYQYKLEGEGFPDSWSKLQKETTVSLKMLPPGDYTFSVRGIDSFNDVNPEILSYSFSIKPYFYETSWFKFLSSAFIIGGIILLGRYRIKREAEKNQLQNTLVELKLKAIQSKMNPHFMFNSLNNIIYLLNIERYDEAEQLLQEFSLLMRRFLEKSDYSFISLEEELEIQQLYLAIQQKRYNYLFNFTIDCPEELLQTIIPTMLIQPFVENAIIHGIAHSKTPCQISITVRKEQNQLIIKIEDNGIGRKKSTEINSSRENHISQGTALVEEKINVTRQHYNIPVELLIEDLEQGTLVTLKLSLNEN